MHIKPSKSKYLEREKKRKKFLIWTGFVVIAVIFSVIAAVFFTTTKQAGNQMTIKKDDDRSSINPSQQKTLLKSSDITIEKAVFESEYVNGRDVLKIVTVAKGATGDEIQKRYEWKINEQDAGNGADRISGFKRGDKIAVKVTPYTEKQTGHPIILRIQIENSTPEVSGGKELINDGKVFSYQINARDPDGDQVTYELLSAPEGMTIDKTMGTLNWTVNKEIIDQPITVRITDMYGAQVSYKLSAALRKDSTAKNP